MPVEYRDDHRAGCRFLLSMLWLDTLASRARACADQCLREGQDWYGNQVTFAACAGDLPTLEYFHSHHPHLFTAQRELNTEAIAYWLVRAGHLNAVQWLYEHHRDDFRWDELKAAAEESQKYPALCDWLVRLQLS